MGRMVQKSLPIVLVRGTLDLAQCCAQFTQAVELVLGSTAGRVVLGISDVFLGVLDALIEGAVEFGQRHRLFSKHG